MLTPSLLHFTHLYGLIGYPLSHSFSKQFFNTKFKQLSLSATHHYDVFPLHQIEDFEKIHQYYPNLKGVNVTIPYKQSIFSFLTDIDSVAQAVGAVNCIYLSDNNTRKGYNTDVYGFEQSLLSLLPSVPVQALVLGNGGSAKAVVYVLKKLNIPYQIVSRQGAEGGVLGYDDINEDILQQYHLIINTTPLGMYPNVVACPPLPYDVLGKRHILYDLIYNPSETLFLQKGAAQGARIKSGLDMLYLQAEKSWEIWQGNDTFV